MASSNLSRATTVGGSGRGGGGGSGSVERRLYKALRGLAEQVGPASKSMLPRLDLSPSHYPNHYLKPLLSSLSSQLAAGMS